MTIKEYVKKYDPQNQFEVLINTYKQVEFAWSNKYPLASLKDKKVRNIVISGLGGSAISADLLVNFLNNELKVPVVVNRNYSLPSFANKNTLLIVSSYSGNTEETVSVLKEGLKKKCKIVCVSTGGKVEEIAKANKLPLVKLQPGFQPRYSLGLSFFSLLKILQNLSLIDKQNSIVKNVVSLWKKRGLEFSKEGNTAFEFACQMLGFIPVIYTCSGITEAAGYRLKCQFNENSKLHAFHNVLPEMNHNEIIGWESYLPKNLNSKVIFVVDESYHPQVLKRFSICSELISSMGAEILELKSDQKDLKVRILDLIFLGDWITYYTALLRGYDPSEIDNINTLKKRLE
ncbi:MAG: bifunctional phosphoglucose/phosphomannose isomerase [Ignavibacteriales bacterium]|nr:MAG: bifunctional phosphoglucose/phosphomannose isomerase [Ignavibacteriales bacterium]